MPYNRGMKDLDILLPFGLPPPDTARDLIRECRAPSLAMLLARGAPQGPGLPPAIAAQLPVGRRRVERGRTRAEPALEQVEHRRRG